MTIKCYNSHPGLQYSNMNWPWTGLYLPTSICQPWTYWVQNCHKYSVVHEVLVVDILTMLYQIPYPWKHIVWHQNQLYIYVNMGDMTTNSKIHLLWRPYWIFHISHTRINSYYVLSESLSPKTYSLTLESSFYLCY